MKENIRKLKTLYKTWSGEEAQLLTPFSSSGSSRQYFRIAGTNKTAIGVYSPDKRENKAFTSFTKHFLQKELNVPELYAQKLTDDIYLIEDLGDTTLFNIVNQKRSDSNISEDLIGYYKTALSNLIRFQIDGGKGLDYSLCYPERKFGHQSIMWDLNYFKYYFLKLAKINFDEQKLEIDFNSFSKILLTADNKYFMYRDFQSRNILVHNGELFFIDYQGGRKGPLQYDVASLLFQAKLDLPNKIREKLLSFYLGELQNKIKMDPKIFKKHYYNFVLIRLLQTLGAYGYRGYFENKSHFLTSIPFALKNLKWLNDNNRLPKNFKELLRVIKSILANEELKTFQVNAETKKLKITINSFSYKAGLPKDYSGNGGGFVFDCRSLENPGRYSEYVNSTGKDENVKQFLEKRDDVMNFLNSVFTIIDSAVMNYINRDFKHLMINFGCTGGQHRSVYCAEILAKHIREKFDVLVELSHKELDKMGRM